MSNGPNPELPVGYSLDYGESPGEVIVRKADGGIAAILDDQDPAEMIVEAARQDSVREYGYEAARKQAV